MNMIYTRHGRDTFHQVLEDCLFSNHPKSLSHLAPAVMPIRRKFDPNYLKITSEWGGGYPRPMVEFSEKLWDFTDTAKLIRGPQRD